MACIKFSEHRAQLLEVERDQLQRAAHEDALTGIGNRRAADEMLALRLQDPAASGPTAVALVDLDHFKRINDSHGHAVGDAVLGAVGSLMRQALRSNDRIFRYGGEEFLLILQGASATAALEVRERLRLAIECHGWDAVAAGLAVTASFGMASTCAGDSPQDLLRRADVALYAAKGQGRNRVVAG